jgi:hypothetical protein
MRIQFRIDPVDLFLKGINADSSIVTLDVDPAELAEPDMKLIHRHLLYDQERNLCSVVHDPVRAMQEYEVVPVGGRPGAELIKAKEKTLASLLVALAIVEAPLAAPCSTGAPAFIRA